MPWEVQYTGIAVIIRLVRYKLCAGAIFAGSYLDALV